MGAKQVRECCKLDDESRGYLEHAMEQMNFSARAHDRILKVSRTFADLAGAESSSGDGLIQFHILLFVFGVGFVGVRRNAGSYDKNVSLGTWKYLTKKFQIFPGRRINHIEWLVCCGLAM